MRLKNSGSTDPDRVPHRTTSSSVQATTAPDKKSPARREAATSPIRLRKPPNNKPITNSRRTTRYQSRNLTSPVARPVITRVAD